MSSFPKNRFIATMYTLRMLHLVAVLIYFTSHLGTVSAGWNAKLGEPCNTSDDIE